MLIVDKCTVYYISMRDDVMHVLKVGRCLHQESRFFELANNLQITEQYKNPLKKKMMHSKGLSSK